MAINAVVVPSEPITAVVAGGKTVDVNPSDITYLKGDKGDPGPQGIPGPTGATGSPGKDGKDGKDGVDGQDGVGVPTGGSSNEVLKKKSNTDYDTEWGTVEALPTGGTTGQVLKKASSTDYDTEWGSVEALPTGGTTGQALVKHSDSNYDVEWADVGGGDVQTVNSVQPDANGNVQITASNIGTNSNGISVQDAIDDAVHVGTSAPTDPTTKIWLDTDEPGMSAVSSVNGATGTVVLDADDVGAMDLDLLWTNASPSSNFAEQTLEIDLTDYELVYIVAVGNSSSYLTSIKNTFVYKVGGNMGTNYQMQILTGTQTATAGGLMSRTIDSITSSGISFKDGYSKSSFSATTAATVSNNNVVPLYIYGMKG